MATLLVLDDERSIREMLEVYLTRQGHQVTCASNLSDALVLLGGRPYDLALSDLRLGKDSGLTLVDEVKRRAPGCEVIVMTAFSTIETAVQAMKAGAYDYVQKPFNLDELKLLIDRALERRSLVAENARLRTELGEKPRSGLLIGHSQAIRDLVKLVDKVAAVRANVLITGESGVGKEVVAREIHARGPRKDAPFLAVNCGAIPEGLIESELFGHVKGAFTGAVSNRQGLLAAAADGTLFLDEIGELPKDTQVKLLRVIQERKARPVGSVQDFDVQARLVAATNRDLSAEVARGNFREDLFYRLNVIQVRVPALRERREDVLTLAEHFLDRLAKSMGRPTWTLGSEDRARLLQHPFPGNVRELENMIERAVALADPDRAGLDVIGLSEAIPAGPQAILPEAGIDLDAELARVERALIGQALERSGGVKVMAARLLGTSFRSLRYRLQKLGFKETSSASESDDPE
ncbi:MAG: sigma-54-dependent transcriptional regulator [Deltaproteobacteria bacterium]